jgi:hypothetical protein
VNTPNVRVFAVTLAVAALAGAVPALAAGPSLRVTETAPFSVRGTGFVPSERVTVSVLSHVKTTVAQANGVFLVHFWSLRVGDCQVYVVRASGNCGTKATFRRKLNSEECGPPPQS